MFSIGETSRNNGQIVGHIRVSGRISPFSLLSLNERGPIKYGMDLFAKQYLLSVDSFYPKAEERIKSACRQLSQDVLQKKRSVPEREPEIQKMNGHQLEILPGKKTTSVFWYNPISLMCPEPQIGAAIYALCISARIPYRLFYSQDGWGLSAVFLNKDAQQTGIKTLAKFCGTAESIFQNIEVLAFDARLSQQFLKRNGLEFNPKGGIDVRKEVHV